MSDLFNFASVWHDIKVKIKLNKGKKNLLK